MNSKINTNIKKREKANDVFYKSIQVVWDECDSCIYKKI